ncbi:MAG: HDOD domain-containing protein [Gammaproteobacteria bacterium]|jgi:HD-like signal output (HDOD) protein|nr:HDOD domain-containing protein [Gammaproteobacteria bacterium]
MIEQIQPTAGQIAARVKGLVSPPGVYLRLRGLMADATASLGDIADVVSTDPALAARVLRVANSAYFGHRQGVDTIRRAVTVLGTRQIHDLVLATSVIGRFKGIPLRLVDMRGFWRASVFAAAASQLLAERCHIVDCERMFVAGLLAQVGQLVLYMHLPSVMSRALEIAQHEDRPIHLIERELLGFDYAAVSAELFTAWQLPPSLVEPIRHHTDPTAAGDGALEASVVGIAVALAADASAASPPPDSTRRLGAKALGTVGLTAGDLVPLCAQAARLSREAVGIFLAAA